MIGNQELNALEHQQGHGQVHDRLLELEDCLERHSKHYRSIRLGQCGEQVILLD
jgi:hypothetical protein